MGWAKGFWMWLTPAMPGISAIGAAFDIPGPHIGAAAAIAVLLVWATVGFGLVLRIIDRGFFHRGRRP
jgi:hypothetical protein